MKSIRRLYFYLVAFISIEIVVWGLIGLLRSTVDRSVSGGADALAQALALILVGVPIFLIHWLWAQRISAKDPEEKEATLRAVFLYAILFGTLIPVVQNLLAFIDRSLVQLTGLGVTRAFDSFRNQSLADNLIAIVMNLIVAAYFWNILRGEWAALKDRENFSEVRRLYRYLWMMYGLLMTVFGTQQVLRYIIYIPGTILGDMGRETLINGLALLVVGVPVWVYAWRIIQSSLSDADEAGSNLRLGILYFLALGGVITVITTGAMLVNTLISSLLGSNFITQTFVREIGGPVSVGLPLGMVWAYFGYWLTRHIEAAGDKVKQASLKRLYYYVLAFIGLVVSFISVATLFTFIIDTLRTTDFINIDANRSSLANGISMLIVGLPLWLMTWRPMQTEALAHDEMGDHARRSVLRKTYLYLALFASVIGGMITAVALVYLLISVLLTGDPGSDFAYDLLQTVQLLFLFVITLIYHYRVLQQDGKSVSDMLAQKQSAFDVLVLDSGEGFVDSIQAALTKAEAKVRLTTSTLDKKPEGNFGAMILSGAAALDAPAWVKSFAGNKVIVQNETNGLVWADDAMQAAESISRIAEGQEVQKTKRSRSAWMFVIYVFAALFAIEVLFFLLAVAMSLISGL